MPGAPRFGRAHRPGSAILLKNSVSAQGRRICRDVARFDCAVPRGYRQKVPASPESSLLGSTETCWLFSLSTPRRRKYSSRETEFFNRIGHKQPFIESICLPDSGHSRPTETRQSAVMLPTSTISISAAPADADHCDPARADGTPQFACWAGSHCGGIPMRFQFSRVVVVGLASLSLAACGGGGDGRGGPSPPASVTIVAGNGQTGEVGTLLPVALTVRVTDSAAGRTPAWPSVGPSRPGVAR